MENPKEGAVPLDGNAAAGLLRELFVLDLTVAALTCEGCGAIATVAEVRVYGGPMGAIFRRGTCDTAVLRLSRTPIGFSLDMRGARCLRVPTAPA
jgi:Family of unknown function (DUF6510)